VDENGMVFMSFLMSKQASKQGVGCTGLEKSVVPGWRSYCTFAGYGRKACFKMLRLTLHAPQNEP
jgi:hypothetical protein